MLAAQIHIRKGYPFLTPSTTNQQFPILPNELLEKLKTDFEYSFWDKIDESHSAVRFCTSWATPKESVLKLIAEL
jgi:threonine aldolase